MTRASRLHSVPPSPVEPEPDELLAQIVPELLAAEADVARLSRQMAVQSRLLANARGVAFIREERVRQEFGAR